MEEETSFTQYLDDNNIFLFSIDNTEYTAGKKLCLERCPGESSYPYPYYFEKQYSPAFLSQLNQKEVARRIKADIDRVIRGGK